ncbi:hypothetical protein NB037_09615 [Rathayibacter sp. ZW T2_19]|uniref:Uncharacterized protein n=1 Tax=Rathayibacter rubneri TaxID=2950106 RepID=A0A9X2ISG9_9MICO|nr:hypothetical protein [Rathayibacter rubneri]MCM6762671.1 hypothetical protein [Rathayibacter rubneri]
MIARRHGTASDDEDADSGLEHVVRDRHDLLHLCGDGTAFAAPVIGPDGCGVATCSGLFAALRPFDDSAMIGRMIAFSAPCGRSPQDQQEERRRGALRRDPRRGQRRIGTVIQPPLVMSRLGAGAQWTRSPSKAGMSQVAGRQYFVP